MFCRQNGKKIQYDPVIFGERIAYLRKREGLTQEQLAAELKISPNYMQKIEKARRNCTLELVIDAAAFFNTSVDYMLFGNNSTFTDEQKKRILSIADELKSMADEM